MTEMAEEAGCATLVMEAALPASWMLETAVAIRTSKKAVSDWPMAPKTPWIFQRPLGQTFHMTAYNCRNATTLSEDLCLRASSVANFHPPDLARAIRDSQTSEELRLDCQMRRVHSSCNPTMKNTITDQVK